jgi:hypothetical protein
MFRVAADYCGKGTLCGRSHNICVAAETTSSQMHGLMHGTTLEEVVALVGTTAGIEE